MLSSRRIVIACTLVVGALIAGCVPFRAPEEAPVVVSAVVIRHTDGDTAWFRLADGTGEKVRFIGIDTPETAAGPEPLGEEASAYTARAIPIGTRVWLEYDAELRDRHGRLLAYVWLERPLSGDAGEVRESMLNARILLDGYAQTLTIPPNVAYAEVLSACQVEAREAQRGLWGLSD
jgi:micrococcal nuclease